MRVTFNSTRDQSLLDLSREATNQARIQNQISSGQKISSADQDPQTAQKILSLQSGNAQAQQYYRNAGYALDISRASFSAMDAVRSISDRAGEVAGSISGLTTPDGFKGYATEVDGLIEQAITSVTQQFDGKYLFGGTKNDTVPYTVARDAAGKVTSVSYVGAAQGPAIQVADNATVSPYTDGSNNSDTADFINRLISLRDSLQSGDSAAVNAQRPGLQDSEEDLLNTLGVLGAQQSRMEASQNAASSSYDASNGRIGSLNDLDLAKAMIDLTKSQTAYQAGLQATAKIASHSLLDYI